MGREILLPSSSGIPENKESLMDDGSASLRKLDLLVVSGPHLPHPLLESVMEKFGEQRFRLNRLDSIDELRHRLRGTRSHPPSPPDLLVLSPEGKELDALEEILHPHGEGSRNPLTTVVIFSLSPGKKLLSLANRNRKIFIVDPENGEDLLHIFEEAVRESHDFRHRSLFVTPEIEDLATPLTILLVEDNAGDRILLREMFRDYPLIRPLTLLAARTLSESRRFLGKTPIDAVLLDLALPDGQGLETLRKFRAMNDEIPVVVLSGMKEEAIAISSLSAGAQDFLVKEMVTAPLLLRSVTYAIKRKEIERSLTTLANSDTLTGLPNRKSFMEQLQRSIDTGARSGDSFCLLILDLDRFKAVNDTYGHAAGDTLIREVAGRLRRLMRRADFVARLGGDEFAIILSHTGRTGSLSRFIEKLVLRLSPPYSIGRHSVSSEASVGAAVFPFDGDSAEALVSHADRAMYRAKSSGTRRYAFYDPAMDKEEFARAEAIREISRALAEDAFQLCFQPVVNLLSGELVYAEALVRWNHPEKGYLSPHSFLPLIAGTGTTNDLDHWVLDAAIAQISRWQTEGHPVPISINLDATTLALPSFPDEVSHCLRAHPELPPDLIRIEVREWIETGNLPRIRHTLELLNNMGILTSLDDFGRGPTTLPSLTALPLEGLKIDQNVILDFQKGDRNMALIEGVASLARSLGHKVVAKGLEKTKYGLLLEKLGCDLAQGFGISSPLPPDEFLAWKRSWTETPLASRGGASVSDSEIGILAVLLSHLEWIYRAILDVHPTDKTSSPVVPKDPEPCPVLPWFSGEGRERYGSLPVFAPLRQITEEIDREVRSMYGELSRGHSQETMAHAHRLLSLKDRLQTLYHSLQKESLLRSLAEDTHLT